MRYLTIAEVLILHERVISVSGGARGVRDLGALESAIKQPYTSFADQNLYPDLPSKAAALCHSLVMNHPFVDGNKRVGHATMETYLMLNGYEIECNVDEQEQVILNLAAGNLSRSNFIEWVRAHTGPVSTTSSG